MSLAVVVKQDEAVPHMVSFHFSLVMKILVVDA